MRQVVYAQQGWALAVLWKGATYRRNAAAEHGPAAAPVLQDHILDGAAVGGAQLAPLHQPQDALQGNP